MKFDQIRRVRKAAHVTQEELAKRIGVNRALISKYETGIIEPSVSQLQKIASALGVPMMELLDFLKENHIKTAVLSNKPHPRTLDNVEGVFGKGYFDLVYGEREDQGIRKKPCPDGVWAIAEELGLSKSEILYLGDTNTDMETGNNAKVDTVGVTWGFRTREELMAFHPALIADHPSRVVQYIKDVNGIE